MNYTVINKSQLEGGLRLDAEFYHPEKLEAMEKLSKFGVSTIAENFRNVKETFNPLRHQLATTPARVFDLSDVSSFLLEEGKEVMESSEVGSTKKIIRQGDVLISRLRPYLKEVSFVGFNSAQKLASTEFVVLRKKKDSKFSPQALFAFLITDEVQRILFWSQGGTEHPRFSENLLMNLKLPKISEKIAESIADDIDNAYKNYLTSRNLYSQAEDLLLEELGLKDFKVDDDLSYIVNLSEVKSAHRADAEYFQPKYKRLVERIKKFGAAPLLDLVQNIPARFNPKSQPTKLFKYVELSNITSSVGMIDGFSEVSGDEAPSRAKRVLKANDVILSSVEGSLEKVALVGKEQEGYLASNGFFQFRSKDILPEVLLVLAKSFILQMQFEKETTGTILTAVPKEAVKNIVVPKINKSVQQKIADLVQKSHEARSKAKELLEQAKQKVESLIDG
jgi:type I restriction enzyme S subunit